MQSPLNILYGIAVIAGVTLFTRALPFLFFRKKEPPKLLLFIEEYIPPMVMVILVIYSVKDIPFTLFPYGVPELTAMILVASLHLWKKNALISIFGGTIFYMAVIQTSLMEKLVS